jgi:hypothetical protein
MKVKHTRRMSGRNSSLVSLLIERRIYSMMIIFILEYLQVNWVKNQV